MSVNSRKSIDQFLEGKNFAVAGVSRSGKKFGNTVYTELKKKGYHVFPINPSAETIDGERCYTSLATLPNPVDGIVVVLPPAQAEDVVEQAYQSGIHNIWLQQGAQSEKTVQFCQNHGMNVVAGECILMFAKPVESFHRFHRFIWRMFGKLPK
jgi:predicted CoA-binding protein